MNDEFIVAEQLDIPTTSYTRTPIQHATRIGDSNNKLPISIANELDNTAYHPNLPFDHLLYILAKDVDIMRTILALTSDIRNDVISFNQIQEANIYNILVCRDQISVLNLFDEYCKYPIEYDKYVKVCIYNNKVNSLSYLINIKNINLLSVISKDEIIYVTLCSHFTALLNYLLVEHIPINEFYITNDKYFLIDTVTCYGDINMFRILLRYGFDINLLYHDNNRPILLAYHAKSKELFYYIEKLISKKIHIVSNLQ